MFIHWLISNIFFIFDSLCCRYFSTDKIPTCSSVCLFIGRTWQKIRQIYDPLLELTPFRKMINFPIILIQSCNLLLPWGNLGTQNFGPFPNILMIHWLNSSTLRPGPTDWLVVCAWQYLDTLQFESLTELALHLLEKMYVDNRLEAFLELSVGLFVPYIIV